MDNITINRSTQTTIDFDMKIDGASSEDASINFVLQCDGYDVSFPCSSSSSQHYTCTIPPIPFIQKGVMDYAMHVIINNQFFKPISGTVTVVDDVKVSVTPTDHNKYEEDEEVVYDDTPTSNSSDLIKAIMHHNVANESVSTKEVLSPKDVKVKEILETMNFKPTKTKKPRTSSLKSLTERKRRKLPD